MPWDYTHAKDLRTEMAFKECAVLNMTTITMFLKKKEIERKPFTVVNQVQEVRHYELKHALFIC